MNTSKLFLVSTFRKIRVNKFQKLMKPLEKLIHRAISSISAQLREKRFFLARSHNLGFLVTCWLPTASFLAVIRWIYRYHSQCTYLKNQRYLLNVLFFCLFKNYVDFWTFSQKKKTKKKTELHSLSSYEVMDFKTRANFYTSKFFLCKPFRSDVLTSSKNWWNL